MATNFSELSHHLSLAEGDGMLGMAPLGVSSILLLIGVKSPRPKRLGSQSRRTAQRWRNSTLRYTNMALGNPPIEDVSPIKNGGFPLLG